MNNTLLTAAAGMKARLESLEVVANNLANSSTVGFKTDEDFYRLFATERARQDPATGNLGWMPVVYGSETDFAQGPLTETGSPLDLALEGPGFFKLEGQGGPLYTRAGSFQSGPDGVLQGPGGLPVLDESGQPFRVPGPGKIEIDPNGDVRVGGFPAGRIAVVEFADPRVLSKAGSNTFAAPPDAQPVPGSRTTVRQGALESSNVSVQTEAVRLIELNRHFEMLRRVASLVGDDMDGRAVETLGRTS